MNRRSTLKRDVCVHWSEKRAGLVVDGVVEGGNLSLRSVVFDDGDIVVVEEETQKLSGHDRSHMLGKDVGRGRLLVCDLY